MTKVLYDISAVIIPKSNATKDFKTIPWCELTAIRY